MILFYSGNGALGDFEVERKLYAQWSARLISCHGKYLSRFINQFNTRGGDDWIDKPLMLDSGAFTAWSGGEVITTDELIDAYSRAIEALGHKVKSYVCINLDVIPGKIDDAIVSEAVKQAAIDQSDVNYEILRRRFGDVILPVLHFGESEERLKQVVEQSSGYICIAPRARNPLQVRIEWSNRILQRVPPGTKVHGLAATAYEMIMRVPWYSVDSSSWLMPGSFGSILLWNDGKPVSVKVSQRAPARTVEDLHFDTMTPDKQQRIKREVESRGWDFDHLVSGYKWMTLFNAQTYEMMRANAIKHPPKPRDTQQTLFSL